MNGGKVSKPVLRKSQPLPEGKTDLLLRFFESQFFDEWIALVYLYQNTSPGVHDYLCNKLYDLTEAGIETYLLQLVYIAVSRPGSPLERVIADFCSKSFRLAVKVYWLLLALGQDQPRNKAIESFKDKCERAALEGQWKVPFENPHLDPLSPGSRPFSPCMSPDGYLSPSRAFMSPERRRNSCLSPERERRGGSHTVPDSAVLSNMFQDQSLGIRASRMDSYDYSSPHLLGHGLEGLVTPSSLLLSRGTTADLRVDLSCLEKPELRGLTLEALDRSPSSAPFERYRKLRAELGEGEGVSALLQRSLEKAAEGGPAWISITEDDATAADALELARPMSPTTRLRQDTFGGTLDFIDALCAASSTLTSYSQEERQRALKGGLESINREIELANKRDVAIWWPMGRRDERVLRITAKEAVLLNSREKAPFMLFVEVLRENPDEDDSMDDPMASYREQASVSAWAKTLQEFADSAKSPANNISTAILNRVNGEACTNDSAMETPLHPPSSRPDSPPTDAEMSPYPTDVATPDQQATASPFMVPMSSGAKPPLPPPSISTLQREPSQTGLLAGIAKKGMELARGLSQTGAIHAVPAKPMVVESPTGAEFTVEQVAGGASPALSIQDSVVKRMDSALAGLRGEAPLVRLQIQVLDPSEEQDADELRRRTSADAGPGPSASGLPSGPFRRSPDVLSSVKMSLFSKIGLVRHNTPDPEQPTPRKEQQLVSVRLEVGGGVKLNIPSPYRKHQRVPSSEAIDTVASKLRVECIPEPVLSGPPLQLPQDDSSSQASIGSPTEETTQLHIMAAAATQDTLGAVGSSQEEPAAEQEDTIAAEPQTNHKEMKKSQEREKRSQERRHRDKHRCLSPEREEALTPAERQRREACAVYGERWSQRVRRIQKESPQGRRDGWALRCVIVKSGDDCRQELMAMQLIRSFQEIFIDAGLPLWLRTYEVLVTSNRTAMIEMVPDSLSIHTVKHRSPPGTSLSDHFFAKFMRGTPECVAAQRKFTESLAAYSVLCYLLQIKDRHNGNILIDDEGRIVHIDFGFMLSNSPGAINFESAPFKLTRELLEIMDSNSEGRPSELFDYFKVLCIQGFLAARKHYDRIVLLVRMMLKSGFPCFKAGERALKNLEKRFVLNLTESQVVLGLISESLDAWRTRQYDYYQRVLNGIL